MMTRAVARATRYSTGWWRGGACGRPMCRVQAVRHGTAQYCTVHSEDTAGCRAVCCCCVPSAHVCPSLSVPRLSLSFPKADPHTAAGGAKEQELAQHTLPRPSCATTGTACHTPRCSRPQKQRSESTVPHPPRLPSSTPRQGLRRHATAREASPTTVSSEQRVVLLVACRHHVGWLLRTRRQAGRQQAAHRRPASVPRRLLGRRRVGASVLVPLARACWAFGPGARGANILRKHAHLRLRAHTLHGCSLKTRRPAHALPPLGDGEGGYAPPASGTTQQGMRMHACTQVHGRSTKAGRKERAYR